MFARLKMSCSSRTGRPRIFPPFNRKRLVGLQQYWSRIRVFKIGVSGGYAPVTVSLLAAVVLGRVLGLCGAQAKLVIGLFFSGRHKWH